MACMTLGLTLVINFRIMKYLIALGLSLISIIALSQTDRIIKKNGDTVDCAVIEINPETIRFSLGNGERKSYFNTSRSEIRTLIVGENRISLNSVAQEKQKPTTIWKINPIGLVVGNISLGLEKSISKLISFEVEAILLNQMIYSVIDGDGLNLRLGTKFYLDENALDKILNGKYLRTELLFSNIAYRANLNDLPSFNRLLSKSYGLALNFGKQRTYANSLVIDTYVGAGVGFIIRNSSEEFEEDIYRGQWLQGPAEIPFILSAGFRIGFTAR